MLNRYDLTDTHIVVYYQSNKEFEHVRDLCLQEDNWLRHNYTKDNLKIGSFSFIDAGEYVNNSIKKYSFVNKTFNLKNKIKTNHFLID